MHNFNIDPLEVEKFSKLANKWWDYNGPFKPLHQINPTRIKYIKQQIIKNFNLNEAEITPFKNLSLLDVGCGGGLISEPMSKLGASVTAIDASEKNIEIAKYHAAQMDLKINYLHNSTTEQINKQQTYDIILALEIIEHVPDPLHFIQELINLAKPNGIIILTTINRTIKSYLGAIIGAEYILRWLPTGTHEWAKFLKPSEVIKYLRLFNTEIIDISGLSYNILNSEWKISKDLDINYMVTFKKSS